MFKLSRIFVQPLQLSRRFPQTVMFKRREEKIYERIWGFPKKGGTQQPWVFLLKMIILGCFGGTTI